MGLFGNKREKSDKVDKYEYHSSSKGGRSSAYGPPALLGSTPSPFLPPPGQPFYDGFAQVNPQAAKLGKYGKFGSPNKSLYGMADPMGQAMLLPPQSPAAIQAQAAAMLQMQQYMQGQGPSAQFAGILPPIQMPFVAAQQAGIVPPNQIPFAAPQQAGIVPPSMTPFFPYGQQQMVGSPFFDPNQIQQQQGAFAPYQQLNFYDPSTAPQYAGPYGYMPAAF